MGRLGAVNAHLYCLDAHARERGGHLCSDERAVREHLDTESLLSGRLDEREEVLSKEGFTPGEVDTPPQSFLLQEPGITVDDRDALLSARFITSCSIVTVTMFA